jgi:calcineurin-like phosphoesterase family protein
MDYNLIKNWNEKVPPDGLVFHLGDFGWGGYQEYKKIRDQLNGKIILIKGNHKYFINN